MKSVIIYISICLIVLSGCSLLKTSVQSDEEAVRGAQNVRVQLADQQAKIDDLQKEIQTLRGSLEETENLLKQKIKDLKEANNKTESKFTRLESTTDSNKNRIERLENYLNVESSSGKSNFFTDLGDRSEKELTENEVYVLAKQKFERGDLQGARTTFKEFIEKYPKSDQADNAVFWIGETYFHEKWYEKAILEYQKVIDQYPKGNKVPAALLKQGISFFRHGDITSAQLIMKELIDKYPKTSESEIAETKLKEYKKLSTKEKEKTD